MSVVVTVQEQRVRKEQKNVSFALLTLGMNSSVPCVPVHYTCARARHPRFICVVRSCTQKYPNTQTLRDRTDLRQILLCIV